MFSRDDVLNLVCKMANRFREERKDNQDSELLIGGVVLLESLYSSLERLPHIEIEVDD